jgi:hypothetical protein
MVACLSLHHDALMDMGIRNLRDSGGLAEAATMSIVVLYDGPVILERARQLMLNMHGSMREASPLNLVNWRIDALDAETLAPHLRRSLAPVEMIVVAIDAIRPLSAQVLRQLENLLASGSSQRRAIMAFLEGSSPIARTDDKPFAQLQKLAFKQGADFFAHIADPAPRPAIPYLNEVLPPGTKPLFS